MSLVAAVLGIATVWSGTLTIWVIGACVGAMGVLMGILPRATPEALQAFGACRSIRIAGVSGLVTLSAGFAIAFFAYDRQLEDRPRFGDRTLAFVRVRHDGLSDADGTALKRQPGDLVRVLKGVVALVVSAIVMVHLHANGNLARGTHHMATPFSAVVARELIGQAGPEARRRCRLGGWLP